MQADKRGPKIGDAASLWNFTPSPGWTKEESYLLKLCLMKFGVGQWVQILNTGLLPGKMIQQLNGQTQRLLGQQSLAAYTGLQVDIDRIRADNSAKADVVRKNGLIIWAGENPTKGLKTQWQREAKEKYGLSVDQMREVEEQLEEAATQLNVATGGEGQTSRAACRLPPISIMGADARELSRVVKVVLLTRLHGKLRLLTKRLRQRLGGAVAAGGDGSGGDGAAAAAAAGSSGAASDDDEDDDEEKLLLSDQLVISGVGGAGTGTDSDVGDVIGQRMRQQQAGASRGRKAGGGGAARGGLGAAGGVAKKQAAASGGKGASGKPPRPPSSRGGRAAGGGGVGSRRKYVDDSDDDDEEDKEVSRAAFDANLSQLGSMGFSPRKARRALQSNDNSLEAAVDWLFARYA